MTVTDSMHVYPTVVQIQYYDNAAIKMAREMAVRGKLRIADNERFENHGNG
jgi:hypothetical protein